MSFSAALRPAGSFNVNWYRGGQVVGQDSAYTFVPASVGKDTLQVGAFSGAVRDTYYWVITVEEDVSAIPPAVQGLQALAGPNPADVVVMWNRVTGATFPLVEYVVAVNFGAPVTEATWDQATILGRYTPVPGQIGYAQTYTQETDGMRPGERAWFAVRVTDDRQQISPLSSSFPHDITWPWYLSGHVTDDAGKPLLGIIVNSSGPGYSSNTDGSGYFLFDEPFRNIDDIIVWTASPSWYDFVTDPVSVVRDTTETDIVLLNKYGLESPSCWSGDFLEFFRFLTWNEDEVGDPDKSRLYTWDEYPVTVHIPPLVNSEGVDMEAACLAAIDFWNDTMRFDANILGIAETDYFVRTSDQAAADIVFKFEFTTDFYGKVSLLLPAGDEDRLSAVIPEKMQVLVSTVPALNLFTEVQGVALHELGHTLGIFAHADCSGVDYLMQTAGGTGAMNRPVPIHQDEIRAVRAIRNIPQGANLSGFTLGRIELEGSLFH